jgi:hypothetical protein
MKTKIVRISLCVFAVLSVSTFIRSQQPGPVAPEAIPKPGVFQNPVMVRFTAKEPGIAVYYTLDGSTPTTSSIPYGMRPGEEMPAGGPPDVNTVAFGVEESGRYDPQSRRCLPRSR